MIIEITSEEKKELESIRKLFKSDDIDIQRLALNLLKRYEGFNKYYTYLYRKKYPIKDVEFVNTEYYVDTVNGNKEEFFTLIYIEYYFNNYNAFYYANVIRKVLLEAIIQERDVFYEDKS